MKKDSLSPLLYIIILIEGYIVLSTELLAIRQTIPFVGTGTDTVSIIIAAVLMPLAIGYYTGGRFRPCKIYGNYISLRKKLTFNLILSTVILLPGMSLVFMEWFFQNLLVDIGITSRIVQTSLYATFFVAIFYPEDKGYTPMQKYCCSPAESFEQWHHFSPYRAKFRWSDSHPEAFDIYHSN